MAEGHLERIRLGQLLDQAHLDAIEEVTGKSPAADIVLHEPTMEVFNRIVSPMTTLEELEKRTDDDWLADEGFAVSATLRLNGATAVSPANYRELPATTAKKLSAIIGQWIRAIHEEGAEGLGKRMEAVGLKPSAPPSDEDSQAKSASSS